MSSTTPSTPSRVVRERARPDSRSLEELERVEDLPARAVELTPRREEACPRVALFSASI